MTSFTPTTQAPQPWPLPPDPSTPSGPAPRVPNKGTWTPAGYRSAGQRTGVATFLHGLAALATVASMLVIYQVFGLLDKLDRFQLTAAEDESWAANFELTNNIDSWASLLAVVSLMTWLSRSVDNTPSLGGGIARRGPRWAIGAWFIPIVNVVMPALILRDLARRLSPDGTGRGRLVLAWWLVYWAPVVISFYVVFLPIAGTDSLRTHYTSLLLLQLLNVFGYLATIIVVRRLQQDAEYWHAKRRDEWQAAADAARAQELAGMGHPVSAPPTPYPSASSAYRRDPPEPPPGP